MSSTTVTMRKVRPATVGLWALQVLLTVSFAGAGLAKLSGDPAMVDMFAEIGAGQWFRYVVGALELAGAVGLLVPRLCGAAALWLAGLMVGAVVTNVFVLDESPAMAFGFLLVAALVVYVRRATTRDLVARLRSGR